jgi:hypothetical protein
MVLMRLPFIELITYPGRRPAELAGLSSATSKISKPCAPESSSVLTTIPNAATGLLLMAACFCSFYSCCADSVWSSYELATGTPAAEGVRAAILSQSSG